MTTPYSAPNGSTRPFANPSFPGAPPFGAPSRYGTVGNNTLAFPVGNGPPVPGSGISGFAGAVAQPNRHFDFPTNGKREGGHRPRTRGIAKKTYSNKRK